MMGIGRPVVKSYRNKDGFYSYSVSLRFRKHIMVPGIKSDHLEDIGMWLIQMVGHCRSGTIKIMLRSD